MNPNMIENVIYLLLGATLVYVSFVSRDKVSREETAHQITYINTGAEEVPKKGKSAEDEEELNTFFN